METTKGVIHAIFECCDCGKIWEDFITARKKAYQHARKYKHIVKGDIGYGVIYNGKQKRKIQ